MRQFASKKEIYDILVAKGCIANLGAAIATNDVTQVRALIEENPGLIEARFDILDCRGARPLAIATGYKRTEIAQMLIEAGADVNVDNDLALYMAHANQPIMQLLVDHGARVHPYPAASCSPLVFACEIQNITSVEFLLAKGADPNACVYSEFRQGYPINPEQGWKNPALWLTKSKRQMLPLFVAFGTPFGTWPNKQGGYYFLPQIVEALIEAGADFTTKRPVLINGSEHALTPLSYALELTDRPSQFSETVGADKRYLEAIEILRKHRAPK